MSEYLDLWGEVHEAKAPRRKKNGVVMIGQMVLAQERMFTPEEMQVPFPDAPLNTVADLGETAVGLFAKQKPAVKPPELFEVQG